MSAVVRDYGALMRGEKEKESGATVPETATATDAPDAVETSAPVAPGPRPARDYGSMIAAEAQARRDTLKQSLSAALHANPDEHAKVLDISNRIGLPPTTVASDLPGASRAAASLDIPLQLGHAPELSKWMERPDNAAVAHDDLESLGLFEFIWKTKLGPFMSGVAQMEQASRQALTLGDPEGKLRQTAGEMLGGRASLLLSAMPGGETMMSMLSQQWNEAKIEELAPMVERDYGTDGWRTPVRTGLVEAQKLIPQMGASMVLAGVGAVAGGAVAGPAGAAAGLRAGPMAFTFAQEAGPAYYEYRELEGVDDDAARMAAILVGGANSAIEGALIGPVLKALPGGQALIRRTFREKMREMLVRPGFAEALRRRAAEVGKGTLAEVAQEVGQELAVILGASGLTGKTPVTEENLDRLAEVAFASAAGLGVLSGATGTYRAAGDMRRVARANATEAKLTAAAGAAQGAKLPGRSPQASIDFVDRLTAAGAPPTVYVEPTAWNKLFQGFNVDPAESAEMILGPGGRAAYQEAMASGDDLAIPSGRYMTGILADPKRAVLIEDSKLGPNELTPRAAKEQEKTAQADLQKAMEEAAQPGGDPEEQLRESLAGRMVAAGRSPEEAMHAATETASFFATLGQKRGRSAMEEFKGTTIKIGEGDPEGAMSLAQSAVFASPNVREGTVFADAQQQLRGPGLEAFRMVAEEEAFRTGLEGVTVEKGIGDWSDGAEGSIVVTAPTGANPESVRKLAAMLGRVGNQKATIPFVEDETGPDVMWSLDTKLEPQAIRSALDAAGIQFRTLVPQKGGGYRVHVADFGASLADEVLNQAAGALDGRWTGDKGRAEYLGGETRAQGLKAFADVLRPSVAEPARVEEGGGPGGSGAAPDEDQLSQTLYQRAVETDNAQARALAKIRQFLKPAELAKLRRDSSDRLVNLLTTLPSKKEMASVALAGKAKRGWYRHSAEALAHVFGPDAPRFAALLAALSPQTSVEANLENALRVWREWDRAGRPTDVEEIRRVMGRAVIGKKGEGSILHAWFPNSVRALTAEDPSAVVLSGPKVNSFFRNLVGVTDEVTNDAWMASFAAVDQAIFGGSLNVAGTDPGKGPGYLAMVVRTRQAAKELTKRTGETWTPAEVQETIWSWAKTLYEMADAAGETRSAVELVRDKAVTDALIAATPDFRSLFETGRYEQILRDAGYGEQLDTLAQPARADTGRTRAGAEAGTAGEAGQAAPELADLERAARRLDRVRRQRRQSVGLPAERALSATGEEIMFQRVFHGTPHKFDKFTLKKIGEGEGAQAFGWGLYFADKRSVANYYRERLVESGEKGQLYEVDIPEDSQLLAWDKEMSQQPPGVLQKLEAAGLWTPETEGTELDAQAEVAEAKEAYHEAMQKGATDQETMRLYRVLVSAQNKLAAKQRRQLYGFTGASFYRNLAEQHGQEEASAVLLEAGIPGHRYLDQGSRTMGDGSYNYVIWDEEAIQILHTFYQEQQPAPTATPAFKKWFGDSKVVDADGEPLIVYHGTTHVLEGQAFDPRRGNIESDLGGATYFSNTPEDVEANYAGFGPDLTSRVQQQAERIEQDYEHDDDTRERVDEWLRFHADAFGESLDTEAGRQIAITAASQAIAEQDVAGEHQGQTIPVYLSLQNPAVLGGPDETVLEMESAFDDEADEATGEDSGTLIDFAESLRAIAYSADFDAANMDEAVSGLLARADFTSIKLSEAIEFLEKETDLGSATDSRGDKMAGREIIRRALEDIGFDGIIDNTVDVKFGSQKRIGRPMSGMGPDTVHYVAFKPEQIKSAIGNMGAFDPNDPSILHQAQQEVKRGSIRFTRGGRSFDITLGPHADRSTLGHELSHMYLEIYGDVAYSDDAPEGVVEDYQTILEWFGVKTRDEITTEHHELFARTFEKYRLTGKAPSKKLEVTFARFRAWLMGVYGRLRGQLGAEEIPDDIRKVFDRMLATDEEIRVAEQKQAYEPMFTKAAEAGVPDAEFLDYQNQALLATEAASLSLFNRMTEDSKVTDDEWFKEERAAVRKEVTAELVKDPTYRALHLLRTGEMVDGSPVPEDLAGIKLNRAGVVDIKGDGFLQFVRGTYADYGREDSPEALRGEPDVVAELLGFGSGDEMLSAMAAAEPVERRIKRMVDERMQQRFGDALAAEPIASKAMDEVHSDERAHVLFRELRFIARKLGVPVTLDLGALKMAAKRIVAGKKLSELRSYHAAELRAATEAGKALKAGDAQTAYLHKQQQLLNFHLGREAEVAKKEAKVTDRLMKKQLKPAAQERLGKAEIGAREQMNYLLFRFGVGKDATPPPQSLDNWVAGRTADGQDVDVAPWVQTNQKSAPLPALTVAEMRDVRDAVRSISRLASEQGEVLKEGKKVAKEAAVSDLVATAERTLADKGPPPLDQHTIGVIENAAKFSAGLASDLTRMETIMRALDGYDITGAWHQYVWNPFQDAKAFEAKLHRDVSKKLVALIDAMPADMRGKLMSKVHIPGLEAATGQKGPVTRMWLINAVLNMGNAENIQRLTDGNGITEELQQEILARLSAEELQLVQGIWDSIESLWPEISELHLRRTGVPLKKVEPVPVSAPNGTLRGGYFPLVYNREVSPIGEMQEVKQVGQLLDGISGNVAATHHSHDKARANKVDQALRIDSLNTLPNHLRQVIHDVAFREFVVSAARLIRDPRVQETLRRRLGQPNADAMWTWLKGVAAYELFEPPATMMKWTRAAEVIRANTGIAVLAGKIAVATQNFANLGVAAAMSPAAMARGLQLSITSPVESYNFALSRSVELTNRREFFDRDARDIQQQMGQRFGWKPAMIKMGFGLIVGTDVATSVPIFMGAYRKALKKGLSEKDAARTGDEAIRRTIGSSHPGDLPRILRDRGVLRLLTQFHSYMNTQFNIYADLVGQARFRARNGELHKHIFQLTGTAIGVWVTNAIIAELLSGRGADTDDEEEWGDWIVRRMALWPAQLFPMGGTAARGIESWWKGERADLRLTPIEGTLAKIGRGGAALAHAFGEEAEEGEKPVAFLKAAEAVAQVAGVPATAQASNIIRAIASEESRESAGTLLHDAAFGAPRSRR